MGLCFVRVVQCPVKPGGGSSLRKVTDYSGQKVNGLAIWRGTHDIDAQTIVRNFAFWSNPPRISMQISTSAPCEFLLLQELKLKCRRIIVKCPPFGHACTMIAKHQRDSTFYQAFSSDTLD